TLSLSLPPSPLSLSLSLPPSLLLPPLSLKVTGSRPYTTPASVRTGSHSSLVGAGTNGLVTPVKDLFGVKETKQNSTHSSDSTTTQQISDTDLKAFQADRFVGGAIPETPPPTNLC
uniref:Uncharacterized protein n=1 Tax=Amphimedon queenslandica TaxID=400682 RepID=A0A1X7U2X3_AMPQE